jgi:hypothetical protein
MVPAILARSPADPLSLVALWERLPQEGAEAYVAFLRYRDLPTEGRSLRKACARARVPSRWRAWCQQHHWVQRAAAWDAAEQLVRQQAHFDTIATMSRRQAEQAAQAQAALTVPSAIVVALFQRDPEQVANALAALPLDRLLRLAAAVVPSWCKAALLERQARGLATTTVDVNDVDSLGLQDAILADAETAALAQTLVERLTAR